MQIDPAAIHSMRQTLTRPARRSAWMHLLAELLALAQGKAELVSHSERAWASATFAGSRHRVVLRFAGLDAQAAGEMFIDQLPEHEFTLPRQLVADAAVMAVTQTALPRPVLEVETELLLLEDS